MILLIFKVLRHFGIVYNHKPQGLRYLASCWSYSINRSSLLNRLSPIIPDLKPLGQGSYWDFVRRLWAYIQSHPNNLKPVCDLLLLLPILHDLAILYYLNSQGTRYFVSFRIFCTHHFSSPPKLQVYLWPHASFVRLLLCKQVCIHNLLLLASQHFDFGTFFGIGHDMQSSISEIMKARCLPDVVARVNTTGRNMGWF